MDLKENESESHSVMSDSFQTHELYSPWHSPGKNTGVGIHFLLQRILQTQELNPGLPHCRQILYQLSHKEDIKTGWKEYIEVYKKDLHNPDNHDAVITHLEPELLECEVKWALGSITTNKASGGNGILLELFQILKDGAVKVLHSICQQLWKTQQWSQDWKSSVFIPIPKKGNAKECSNYCTIALISHASTEKAMATYSSTLAWKIPWMEEPCRLQSMGSLRVGHN